MGLIMGHKKSSGLPTNGLIAYYPFDGNLNDYSGNAKNGSGFGVISYGNNRKSIPSKSLWLKSGNNAYVETPLIFTAQNPINYSVSTWIFPENISYGTIVSQNSNTDSLNLLLILSSGKLSFDIFPPSGGYISDTYSIPINAWTHIVFMRSNSNCYFYINGNISSQPASTEVFSGSVAKTIIGRRDSANLGYFIGRIDDMRFYNRLLSNSEITTLANE